MARYIMGHKYDLTSAEELAKVAKVLSDSTGLPNQLQMIAYALLGELEERAAIAGEGPIRMAIVESVANRSATLLEDIADYLPKNYWVEGRTTEGHALILGRDRLGYTLDDFVIPRLGSALIHAKEVKLGEIR